MTEEQSPDSECPYENWNPTQLHQASYKDLGTPAFVEERFYQHMIRNCERDIHDLLQQELSVTTRDYSINIDTFEFINNDPVLGYLLIKFPSTLLPLLENAIVRAQQTFLEQRSPPTDDSTLPIWNVKGSTGASGSAKTTRVHARLVHLPPTCCKPTLGGSSVTADDVGKIWQVTGTVVRAGLVQMYESARTYKCCGFKSTGSFFGKQSWNGGRKAQQGNDANDNATSSSAQKRQSCGRTFLVHADLEQRNNALCEPETCPGMLPDGSRCLGTKFSIVEGGSVHTDYQEIKIQDASSSNTSSMVGHIPRSLLIKLQHDLVDRCQPGDEVVVVGILLAQWQHATRLVEGMECHVTMAMTAHSLRVISENGASAWKDTSSGGGNKSNHLVERDSYQKDFEQYWSNAVNVEYPIAARDFICQAVCPKLYGMKIIKLAFLITLIGGVSSDVYVDEEQGDNESNPNGIVQTRDNNFGPDSFHLQKESNKHNSSAMAYHGYSASSSSNDSRTRPNRSDEVKTRRRDISHLLLVGDPGTGKSQFLRFAAALCPRSVLTTGVGTTSAGLTCAAVREGNGKEFSLEAGALVLADKGVCCVDEFGCIREADRTTIHEAMEQMTISVAKAGIVCKLNCRTTIIAVMNPRNCIYDNHASLSANTGLGTPLLSRFDIIFKLIDSSDVERDHNVATYLLNRAIQGAGFDVVDDEITKDFACNMESSTNFKPSKEQPWPMEKLRAYISVVKDRFQPRLSDDAAILLEHHYETCRSARNTTIPVTVRFLESLIRLSQAHARLMHRETNTVTLQDAVAVIEIMECTAFASGGFDGQGMNGTNEGIYRDPMTVDFSHEADLDFLCFEYLLLERYGLLSKMATDRKAKALALLNENGSGNDVGNNAWHDLEQKQYDGYCAFPSNQSNLAYEASQATVTQDHYGRLHFGSVQSQTSLSGNSNKRARF